MAYKTIEFNEIKKDWLYLLKGRTKAPFPSMQRNTITVPGMDGAHLTGTQIEPLIIEQPVGFVIKNDNEWLMIKDELSSWLYTTDPAPLIFPDEPNRTYYAVVQNTMEDFERIATLRQGTIQFLCVDPYAYGTEQSYPISGTAMIPNEGTADTYPVFDLTVTEESSLIQIGNLSNMDAAGDRRAVYLGTEDRVDVDTVNERTLIMHDTMRSTSGWTGASDVDSGYVSGQMQADLEGFYADPYGDENDEETLNVWVGPSLKKGLSKPLRNFEAILSLANHNYRDGIGDIIGDRGVGIMEFYFRDINGNMVCKIQFGDVYYNAAINHVVFAVPGRDVREYKSANPVNWNDFTGMLRVKRESGNFYPSIVTYRNGKVAGTRNFGTIIPKSGSAGLNDVATIQVAVRKYHKSKRISQRIGEIKLFETINQNDSEEKVVHRFYPGDKIHIDVQKGLFLLNGEPRTDLVHLDSDFFSLVEGLNQLESSNNFTGTISFRNRYL